MDAVTGLAILMIYLFLLSLGGIAADHVLPHIPFLVRYIDTLPDWEDDAKTSSKWQEDPNHTNSPKIFGHAVTFPLRRLYYEVERQMSRFDPNKKGDHNHENEESAVRFPGGPYGDGHRHPRSGC